MIYNHQRGRPKSADQILMAIKAVVLEFDHYCNKVLATQTSNEWKDAAIRFQALEVIQKIRGAYKHNNKLVAPIYLEAINWIENKISNPNFERESDKILMKESQILR